MTWKHAAVIIFALLIVAMCGIKDSCHDVMPQLATLASGAIGGVLGNAMNEQRSKAKRKPDAKAE